MAFYDPKEDENEADPNGDNGGIQTGPSSGVIDASGGGSSNATPGAAQAASAKPDKPGNFVGIHQYLNANKPQAAKLGDQTAGVINTSADQARQGIGALNQEAQDKIKTVNPLDQNILGKIQNNAESLSGDERNLAKTTAAAKYAGPSDATQLTNYQSANQAQQKAVNNINNSGTEQGRMDLVSQINSKPRTQGINIFDNALLQAGGGREKLAQAANANQDVKGGLDQAASAINSQIGRADDPSTPDIDESAGAIGTTNQAQSGAYKTIQDALANWQSGFQPKVGAAQQQLIDQENAINQALSGSQLSPTDENLSSILGLQDLQGSPLYNLNLKDYVHMPDVNSINAGNAASAEDYARYGALADLAGVQPTLLDPTQSAQAGQLPQITGDAKKLQQDIANKAAAYQNDYNTYNKGILNNSYLKDVAGGYGLGLQQIQGYDPNKDIFKATPKELEEYWAPLLQKGIDDPRLARDDQFKDAKAGILQSLADWKKKQGAASYIGQMPTKDNGHIDWGSITPPKGK